MDATGTARMSTRGQLVIPQKVREATGLKAGEFMFVYGHDDTIILKRIQLPDDEELERIFRDARRHRREKSFTKADVFRAIKEVRRENRRASSSTRTSS